MRNTVGNEGGRKDIEISIYIRGNELDFEAVSNVLGVRPTKTNVKGDRRSNRENITSTFKTNSWIFSVLFEKSSFEDALKNFVSLLDIYDTVNISSLPAVEEAFVDIFVSSMDEFYVGNFAEFRINQKSMRFFSSRGLHLTLSIYK